MVVQVGRMQGGGHDKQTYDEWAREWFDSLGYRTCVVGGKGRVADLVAYKAANKRFALIETKSDDETKIGASFCYHYATRDYNLSNIPRDELWTILSRDALKDLRTKLCVVHLVAVTISHQLHSYYWDVLEGKESRRYRDCFPELWKPGRLISNESIEAWLVMPAQHEDVVQCVLHHFYVRGWLRELTNPHRTANLCVAEIFYPETRPRDLAEK